MKFLERDLEEIIFNTPPDVLHNRGLWSFGKRKRQLRIGRYGIADLVTINKPYYHTGVNCHMKGCISVFELKQDKITISAFLQAVRYAKGIQHFLENKKPSMRNVFNYEIILIGKSICLSSDVVFLPDLFDFDTGEKHLDSESGTCVRLYTYSYEIDGLTFKEHSCYSISNPGF